jgi:hypothetical protein
VVDIDDSFTASVDFNMATTQYKVLWISKDKIYDENGKEIDNWLIRAQDSVTFTNSARVVDELTAAAGNNSRISIKVNEDDNSSFFVYGNDMVSVVNKKFTVKPYFNDNTIPSSGMVKFYIPKSSSQIDLVSSDTETYLSNGFEWTIDNETNDYYQELYCQYDFIELNENNNDKLPSIELSYKKNNYYNTNNTIKCEVLN